MTATIEHAIKQLFDPTTTPVDYDCSLIVGEKRIGCHRAILEARSAVLKDIIIQSSNAEKTPLLEINLPEEDVDAINAIVHYCYTNTISTRHISTPELAGNLLLAIAKFFVQDPLGILCKDVLRALEKQNLPASMEGKLLAVPNSPNLDLTCLIDDNTSSDVVLKTESKDIFAHKCILLSRVPSLSSEMNTTSAGSNQIIDISARHGSVRRVMTFLYGDKVAAASQDEVIEDLITAKKLNVNELKSKLERIVYISDVNALQILKFAVHNELEWLRNAALSTLANGDYDGLFDSIKCLEESCSSISSEFEAVVRAAEQARTKQSQSPQLIQGISFRGCLGVVVTSLSSVLLLTIQKENEFIVALTNVCFCFAIAFFFL